jgi:hypothetical protein
MSIVLKKIALNPWHPLWPHMAQFIKNDRVQFAEGKTEYNITFEIHNKKYRGKIVYQDEMQSFFEVYQEIEVKDVEPEKQPETLEKSDDHTPIPPAAESSPDEPPVVADEQATAEEVS